ncbi:MAG TPA: hypothetical protein DEP84_10255 [Chloroflexi bacterium]|nr:hypothetical protein [Chloroflexota bacterium]
MNHQPVSDKQLAWLRAVARFCREQDAPCMQRSDPPHLLVEWRVEEQPWLVQVSPASDWGLLFLLPLDTIPASHALAALMASGAVNFVLALACVEFEPARREARVRVALALAEPPAALLIATAFQALEKALIGFVQAIEFFKALEEAQAREQRAQQTEERSFGAGLWVLQQARD